MKIEHYKKDDYIIFTLTGVFKGAGSTIKETVASVIAKNNIKKVAFILENLEYIDSYGIGILVSIMMRARKSGGKLALIGATKEVKNVLEITLSGIAGPLYNTLEHFETEELK